MPKFKPAWETNEQLKQQPKTVSQPKVRGLHRPGQNTPASGGPKQSVTRGGARKNQTQIVS